MLAAVFCKMAKAQGLDCKTPPNARLIFEHFGQFFDELPAALIDTSCVSGPVNVPHASHTTNLHTHGLHVEPGLNANGTFGDNTYARILPRADGHTRRTSQ